MTERAIFRNLIHVPKMWGVQYPKLFGSVLIGLLITTAGFLGSTGAGIVIRITMFLLGVVVTGILFGACLWYEKKSELANKDDWSFCKNVMNSQSASLNTFIIILETKAQQKQEQGKKLKKEKN